VADEPVADEPVADEPPSLAETVAFDTPTAPARPLPRFVGTTPPIGLQAGSRPGGTVPDGVTFEPVSPAADSPAEDQTASSPAEDQAASPAVGQAAEEVDDLHGPTVDLACRVEPEATPETEEPSPETTAVLELNQTVDLSGRRDPAPDDSRPRQ
jgi:hypothetical protein